MVRGFLARDNQKPFQMNYITGCKRVFSTVKIRVTVTLGVDRKQIATYTRSIRELTREGGSRVRQAVFPSHM